MLEKIKAYFLISPSHPEIERRIDLDNMKFCRMLSAIVMLFETFMLIYYGLLGDPTLPWHRFHGWCYVGYFVASALWFFLAQYATKHMTRHAHFLAVGLSYCAISIFWSMLISATDYISKDQVFVFVTIVICVAGFAFIEPVISVPLFTVSFAAFYAVLVWIDGAQRAVLTNYIVLCMMLMLTCIVRYHTKLSDTTARFEVESLNEKLKQMSLYDELTKVKNRHCLGLDLQGFVGKSLFLMLVDIDGFKEMNDTYGHDFGDCVLKKFALVLQKYFFSHNVYRYGGDEFIVVVSDCPSAVLLEKIAHCQSDVAVISVKSNRPQITFSGGYLIDKMTHQKEFGTLLKRVDKALYLSKRNGRDQMTYAACKK